MEFLSHIFSFFSDPVLRAPTIASMLMCLSAALIGTLVFLRRESLIGEVLSHATYPGIALGGLVAAALGTLSESALASFVLLGALLCALLGMGVMHLIKTRFKVASDSAMTFTLAAFFGVGVTIASRMQFTHSAIYRQVQVYLYGQAATMTDVHIFIYGALAIVILLLLLLFYKELKAVTMDREFARCQGIQTRYIDLLVVFMVALAVVVGIRSVGVVLMSGMLIAPAVAARQLTNRMSRMLIWASFFGVVSGFLGNFLSLELGGAFSSGATIALPTGPMIVLVAAFFALFALLFAPSRGVVVLYLRMRLFQKQCLRENMLKALYKKESTLEELIRLQKKGAKSSLNKLMNQGLVLKKGETYSLSSEGKKQAAHIVRLHRLWEVYLVDYLGFGAERVHKSAEEIEHILTPELEKELNYLTEGATVDPHSQPIPKEQL